MPYVHQYVDRKFVLAQLEEYEVSRGAFAELVGVSDSSLSLFLSGQRGLSSEAQGDMIRALEFFEQLRESSDLPINFSNTKVLRPHFQKFLRARLEEQVVRTEAELRARAVSDPTT